MSIFNQSQRTRVKKNKFDLSHDKKMSLQMGKLIPIMLQEVLPGDSFRVKTEIMLRLAPMIAPIMHRVNVYTHYFFVPNRIIWDNWEEFITGGQDGTSAPVHPYLLYNSGNQFAKGTLGDYLGIPEADPIAGVFQKVNALPFRAYQTIYNEYYRDQTLEDPINFSKGDGDSMLYPELWAMRYKAWEKDYFTSALPWAQRGPEVTIPGTTINRVHKLDGTILNPPETIHTDVDATIRGVTTGTELEMTDSAGNSINELRKAVRLQEWLEKNARGGARYIEQLLSHFGTAPKDERLQRPEYLGGGKQPVVISEVLNTAGSSTIELDPVGEMAGHGISVGSTNGFSRSFSEHGYIIGIMSVIPRSAYMQGIPKVFLKDDKFDYAWPEFAQIGEQPILNKELYYDGSTNDPAIVDATFGYTPRYAEYKFQLSTVHGDFKTNLDYWHMARKFSVAPALTKDFVMVDPDETKRIFAVTDPASDDIYAQVYHSVDAVRPLPYFGTPAI
ncbi:MAG: major capsid protein [Microviridae sp.]|nr:MAG: major capsid protein [Microviridae sp.]